MGRVKEFDREVVLERAMNFFWEHGYRAASMKELLQAMEIGRQSLYDTFGDKHRLFLSSLNLYYESAMGSVVSNLSDPQGGLSAIEDYFEMMCHNMCAQPCRSCLVINTANELAPHDPEVAAIINPFINNLQGAFETALKIAHRKGEVSVDDIGATAWNLKTVQWGLAR